MDASLIAGTVTGLALLYAANVLLGVFEHEEPIVDITAPEFHFISTRPPPRATRKNIQDWIDGWITTVAIRKYLLHPESPTMLLWKVKGKKLWWDGNKLRTMQEETMRAQLHGVLIPADSKDARLEGMVKLLMEHMEVAEKWEFERKRKQLGPLESHGPVFALTLLGSGFYLQVRLLWAAIYDIPKNAIDQAVETTFWCLIIWYCVDRWIS